MRTWSAVLPSLVLLVVPLSLFAAESPNFNTRVLPVFRKYCNGCHNAKDAEGSLVLQDYARAMKGGEGGAVVVAGKSDQSPLWQRIIAEDDTRMPPRDQPSPQPDELTLIKSWIDDGANAPEGGPGSAGLTTPKIEPKGKVREAVTSVAASPDGRWVAFARPQFVEIVSPAGDTRLVGHTGAINEVSVSRSGKWLCVSAGEAGLMGEVTLWRTSDWTRGPVFQGHRDAVYSAQLSPDETTLGTAGYDREVITWDVETAQPRMTLRGHNDAIYSLSFSPGGTLLATASGDRTVKLWDLASGQRLDTFSQPSKDQTTVAFSPNGQFVAAGGVDCRVRIWQISETGGEGTNPILYARFAHEGPVLKVVFSPDGRLLASSSEDRRIKLWETKTFTQVAVLERQSDWVSALAFTANNQQLIVGRMNGEHHAYPVDPRWGDLASHLERLDENAIDSEPASSATMAVIRETEPNDLPGDATPLAMPGIAQGQLTSANSPGADIDLYRVEAKAGERFVFETDAARSGSLADTRLEILDADGRPVLRGLLQAVRDSWINFRPIDSTSPDVRLEFWEEMDLNQFVYMNGEVCKTFRAPQGPDSGFQLYAVDGKRRGYFDTSGAGHAKDEPAYIVEAFAPGSTIVDNGLPVFSLYYANDDDGNRKLAKDSRLTFTAPSDGTYLVKVTDVRGFSGDKFTYSLAVRRPRPDFMVTINTMNPEVSAGSGQRLKFSLNRIDQFEGPVRIDIAGLPPGFEAASPVVIQAGMIETNSVITAAIDAPDPSKTELGQITVLATARIGDRLVTKTIGQIGELKLKKPAGIRVVLMPDDPRFTAADQGLSIEAGTTISAKIVVERTGHDDDVRFDVDNLPHGIIVDNIGLSGVLVRKNETERQIFLTARPWVSESTGLIHAVAQGVGNQASPAIRLHVRSRRDVVAR